MSLSIILLGLQIESRKKDMHGLKEFGIAPPPKHLKEDGSWHVDCPYCGSTYVTLENIFGPTACRSILVL